MDVASTKATDSSGFPGSFPGLLVLFIGSQFLTEIVFLQL